MNNLKYRQIILLSLFIGILFSACKDNWDDHNAISDPILTVNLLAQINKNADLSTFSSYLVKTGYDKVVASSKRFTIWAPTNLALQNLDPAIVSDSARLKQFVGNFISHQSYLTSAPNPVLTIRTLNGKNILFSKTKFEEANIIAADRYVGNGVLHTIDMAVLPKLNAWEYLKSTTTTLQKTFLTSLDYTYRDSSRATVIGIDPKTGIPILQPGTGYFTSNYYLKKAADLSNEDGKYTFVMLTDAAYTAEKTKLAQYFTVMNPLATSARNAFLTDSLTSWCIVKDLVLNGDFTIDNLPDTLVSTDNVKIHLDKSAVVETHKVSNGVVYVMNRIDYQMTSKFKPVIIQGENPVSSYGSYGTKLINTRLNPYTNAVFTEIYIYNHGKASYWFDYQPIVNNAMKYKVYWVAVRDFNTTATPPAVPVIFSQRLSFVTTALLPAFPYTPVNILNYDEIYLGDYTVATGYGILNTYLVGSTTTANGTNSLVLDYIKMVPSF